MKQYGLSLYTAILTWKHNIGLHRYIYSIAVPFNIVKIYLQSTRLNEVIWATREFMKFKLVILEQHHPHKISSKYHEAKTSLAASSEIYTLSS